jgi:tetraacyldisaccharide 4'-kinase
MIFKGGLFLLSIPYAIVSSVRTLLYDFGFLTIKKLPVPVISVGNITAGGTGKTPMIIYIGEILKEAKIPFAVLSRGYGRKSVKPFTIANGDGFTASQIGDEPKMISEKLNCPLGIAADRYRIGSLLLKKFGNHVMLLDDGFSHRKLHRDLNILLIDADNPFGNGFLPKGRLREPLFALKRADVVVITGLPTDEKVAKISEKLKSKGFFGEIFTATRKVDFVISPSGEIIRPDEIKGKPFFLFSGIEGHSKFEASAKALGIEIKGSVSYPDHYPFDKSEIMQMEKAANGTPLLTTEKDLARIGDSMNCLNTLRITIDVKNKELFKVAILKKIS